MRVRRRIDNDPMGIPAVEEMKELLSYCKDTLPSGLCAQFELCALVLPKKEPVQTPVEPKSVNVLTVEKDDIDNKMEIIRQRMEMLQKQQYM